jgi:CheY-like chemotaxis protein
MENVRLLIIDNDRSLVEDINNYFQLMETDFTIYNANSLGKAHEILNSKKVDVIISAYQFPKKNSLEFLSKIKEQNEDISFILFTAMNSEKILQKALNLGVDFYLPKGEDPQNQFDRLCNCVEEIIKNKKNCTNQQLISVNPERLGQGLIILKDTTCLYVNEYAKEILDNSLNEIKNKELKFLIKQIPELSFIETIMQNFFEKKSRCEKTNQQISIEHPDGSENILSITIDITSRREDYLLTYLFINDITESVKTIRYLKRHHDLFKVIIDISFTDLSVPKMSEKILNRMADTLEYVAGEVYLYDEKIKALVNIAQYTTEGYQFSEIDPIPINNQEYLLAYVARSKKPWFIENDKSPIPENYPIPRLNKTPRSSFATLPLVDSKGKLIGILQLQSEKLQTYSQEELSFYRTLSALISTAIERRQSQEELMNKQKQLEKERLELDNYTTTIAHDLRGKLQVIQTYNDLAMSEYQEEIASQIKNIRHFLDNLLMLAKKGKIIQKKKKVDLGKIVSRALSQTLPFESEIEIIVKPLPVIKGDPLKLQEVFENLIMNIIEHAKASEIVIQNKETPEEHRIRITDNSQEIPKKKKEQLIESWCSKTYTSFGFPIVQKIMVAHEASITLMDSKGKGTYIMLHFQK